MYVHDQLMKARHDEMLRAAARDRLAAQARRAHTPRPHQPKTAPARRPAVMRLRHPGGACDTDVLSELVGTVELSSGPCEWARAVRPPPPVGAGETVMCTPAGGALQKRGHASWMS